MPRTKSTRNFRGSILDKVVIKNGKKTVAYDVRVRMPRLDENGQYILDDKGKKTYRDKTVRTWSKSEAQIALINLINDAGQEQTAQLAAGPRDKTFGDLAGYYEREYVKPAVIVKGKKGRGFKGKISSVRKQVKELAEYFGRSRPLSSITYEDLGTLSESLFQTDTQKGTPPAVSTVNEKLSRLRRMLTVAVQKDWLTVNPFEKGDKIIDRLAENRRNRMMTFEEEMAIHEMCQPHVMTFEQTRTLKNGRKIQLTGRRLVDRRHLIPYMIAAVDTALRAGEIFNLEPWQIDFDNEVIYLTKEAAEATKTGEEGIVPMTERLRDVLLDIKARTPWTPHMKIFPRINYDRGFNSAVREAGIKDLQFRDLRSTGATRMVLAGGAQSQVMKITRHRRIKTFLDHYTNVDLANAQLIGRNMDEFIKNERAKVKVKVNDKKGGFSEAA